MRWIFAILSIVLLCAPTSPQTTTSPSRSAVADVAQPACNLPNQPSQYLLVCRVVVGKPLLFNLPKEHPPGSRVRYTALQPPPLSWLVGRSFLWETRPDDTGDHTLGFRRTTTENRRDTIYVAVRIG